MADDITGNTQVKASLKWVVGAIAALLASAGTWYLARVDTSITNNAAAICKQTDTIQAQQATSNERFHSTQLLIIDGQHATDLALLEMKGDRKTNNERFLLIGHALEQHINQSPDEGPDGGELAIRKVR